MAYYNQMIPTKAMWNAVKNDLLKRKTFRVIDVERLTIPQNPSKEEAYHGMVQARTLMKTLCDEGHAEWNQKAKSFFTLTL